MNQQEVISRLLKLDDKVEAFTLTFSGKTSKKVDGLYKPESREIIIHNKNHPDDNSLMYTAIHEFAHHLQFTRALGHVSARAHTNEFYNIFHGLLEKAEQLGIYNNIFEKEPEFVALTKEIKTKFIHVNGSLMKDLGEVLTRAYLLCRQYHASFEDFVDRTLGFNRTAAKSAMKMQQLNINPSIGYDNMKVVASVRDDELRPLAEKAFLAGKSMDMVKAAFTAKPKPADKAEYLIREKERLEKSLENITARLAKIDKELAAMKQGAK